MLITDARRIDSTSGSRHVVAVDGVAALDSSKRPGGHALVGRLNGHIVAVITIRDGLVVADPFRATTAVVDLLKRRRGAILAQA